MKSIMNSALVLEDGNFFLGTGIGCKGESTGTICFNTAMYGYEEVLTDPSYNGQVIIFTFPHIGNTGINFEDGESNKAQIRGFVLSNDITAPSNYRSMSHLQDWLQKNNIVGISGIDTRLLTKHVRKASAPIRCGIVNAEKQISDLIINKTLINIKNSNSLVGSHYALDIEISPEYESNLREKKFHGTWLEKPNKKYISTRSSKRVVLLDFGIKKSIISELQNRECEILVLPGNACYEEVMSLNPDGIVLSNGPGDPNGVFDEIKDSLQKLIKSKTPIFGICFGYQLLSIVFGGRVTKMLIGHHGINHPVKCLKTGAVKITSQNHEFMVDMDNLPSCITPTYISLFDGTLAGMEISGLPIFAVQFHPEASPGPHDSDYLFDDFIDLMEQNAKTQ